MVIYHAMIYFNRSQVFKQPLHEKTLAGTELHVIGKGSGEIGGAHLCGLL
jgi:hypothetical protein